MTLLNTDQLSWTAVEQRNANTTNDATFMLGNTNIPTLSVHNAVHKTKSIQVQSCKGNTTGPKGRKAESIAGTHSRGGNDTVELRAIKREGHCSLRADR